MAKSFTDYVQTVIVKKGLTGLFQCLVMRSSPFHFNVLFLILYYYTSNSLLLYLQLNLAFEGDGGRTGHEDMVVGLVPFDVERAAIHADVALTTCSACEMGGNSGGASSSSTSEGDA